MKPSSLGERLFSDPRLLHVCADALDGVCDHGLHKTTSECVLQASNHTGMGLARVIWRRMDKTPDERREVLRKFMAAKKLKTASWAKLSGVAANSLYNFLNGHSQALDELTYGKLARTAGVPKWQISGDPPEAPSPTSVWVTGEVEAGAFRAAIEWDQSQWYSVDVPTPARFRGRTRALAVRGNSMNLEYPDGSIVIYVQMLEFRGPQDGDDVLVYSYRNDDDIEATVKRFRLHDGKRWLWPVSSDPLHQTPVEVENPGEDIKLIEIVGIVIGGYRPKVL